jgi:hypothetical protein
VPVYVDNMQNAAWKILGRSPNTAVVVDYEWTLCDLAGLVSTGCAARLVNDIFSLKE